MILPKYCEATAQTIQVQAKTSAKLSPTHFSFIIPKIQFVSLNLFQMYLRLFRLNLSFKLTQKKEKSIL